MDKTVEFVEELLELLWTADEDGLLPLDRDHLPHSLRCFLPDPIDTTGEDLQVTIDTAIAQGLVKAVDCKHIILSDKGRESAEPIVRRHRLTENLLSGVLDVSEAAMESTACQMEHILSAEVTNAVCAFLGHPPVCPHGRSIPKGICCERADATITPLIVPASQLNVGEEARVAFIHTNRSEYRQRLSLLGLVPGSVIRLKQHRPALVIEVGHTDLALDSEPGQEIFVRRRTAKHY